MLKGENRQKNFDENNWLSNHIVLQYSEKLRNAFTLFKISWLKHFYEIVYVRDIEWSKNEDKTENTLYSMYY